MKTASAVRAGRCVDRNLPVAIWALGQCWRWRTRWNQWNTYFLPTVWALACGASHFVIGIDCITAFWTVENHARVKWPNDPKLSDRGVRRGTCTVGGKAAVEAGAVTHGAVRCSAWLGDSLDVSMIPFLVLSIDDRTSSSAW